MKKVVFCLVMPASLALSAKAQDKETIFKKFKGDISAGIAASTGSASAAGVVFALEPKFSLTDHLSFGLRIEGAVTGNGSLFGENVYETDPRISKTTASCMTTADYYFTNKYGFRPFAGGGAGVFWLSENNSAYPGNLNGVKFGSMFRVGCEIKHFRVGLECNFIPADHTLRIDYQGNQSFVSASNGYIGIKAGFCFGGGSRIRSYKSKRRRR